MQKKILYVDDEPDQIFTLEQLLIDFSEYELITTNNGHECLNVLENNPKIDLILLDIMMHDIDGIELFHKIKENQKWSQIPIIFLTAQNDDKTKEYILSIDAGYIEKPFEIGKIIQIIEETI